MTNTESSYERVPKEICWRCVQGFACRRRDLYRSRFPKRIYRVSIYIRTLKGANVKAKANAVQGIPEMIEIATGGNYKENDEEKHNRNAKFGWYRYDTYFAIPVHTNDGEVDYYNVFHASLLIRHSEDGKKYLYDIIDIKKETSYPLEP